MPLTPEQRNRVVEKLRQFQGVEVCSYCQSNEWNISDSIFELREFHGGSITFGGGIYPVVPMTCAKCGNTLFFNAIMLGVIEPLKPAQEG